MSARGSALVLKDRQRAAARRRYTAQHKLTVLWQTDACTEPGEIGVLHRWEDCLSRTWPLAQAAARSIGCGTNSSVSPMQLAHTHRRCNGCEQPRIANQGIFP